MRPAWVLLVVVLIGACSESLGPEIQGRRPLTPLPSYPNWYTEVETCSGRAGRYAAIEWFVAERIEYEHPDAGRLPAGGVWIAPHTIVMQERAVDYERAVKHEMLHHILQDPTHSVLYGRCVP